MKVVYSETRKAMMDAVEVVDRNITAKELMESGIGPGILEARSSELYDSLCLVT